MRQTHLLIVTILLCVLTRAPAAQGWQEAAPPYRPGALIVKLRPGSAPRLTHGASLAGLPVDAALAPDLYSLRVSPGQERRLLRELQARPEIAYAQLDQRVSAQLLPTPSLLSPATAASTLPAIPAAPAGRAETRGPTSSARDWGRELARPAPAARLTGPHNSSLALDQDHTSDLLGRRLAAAPRGHAPLLRGTSAAFVPDDPRYPEQWGLAQIGMPDAWDVITDSATIVVAVLDTGVKLDHPDLQGRLWVNSGETPDNGVDDDQNGYVDDVHGWHFYQTYSGGRAYPAQDNVLSDPHGHGTHVMGIVGAATNNGVGVAGIAGRSPLMMVRVLEQDAVGWESDVVRGIHYALDNGARVLSLSLGLSSPGPALAEAIALAEQRGALVVAASGNDGGSVLYPAAYPTVLAVGASDVAGQRAAFTSGGPALDLLAPGVNILSTWSGVPYFARSGTSMAAPHVSGVGALLIASNPSASPASIRSCIVRTAVDAGPLGRDDDYGAGLLDAAGALRFCWRAFLPLLTA